MSDLDFASLLCSRLCHDLVSPVGAITNGLEIMNEGGCDPALKEQVIDLIDKSARQTSNKLQFFRLAFGAGGGFSAELDYREPLKALTSFLDGGRVTLNWRIPKGNGSKSLIKILLNMALIASESLIRGGELTVELVEEEGNAPSIRVTAQGQRVIVQDSVVSVLQSGGKPADMEARTAPALLASSVAAQNGGKIVVECQTGDCFILFYKAGRPH